jgi:hypothetical protein
MLLDKKDVKGAQETWIKCAGKMKDVVNEALGTATQAVRNTQSCVRRLVETLTCGDKGKKCEEYGEEAVQDLKKAFDYFLMMAEAMHDPTLKTIASKALRSGQWYPPGWKDESVAVTVDETAAERFEKEHQDILEHKKEAKAAKMKMPPNRERAKQHAMAMKDGKFKKGKKDGKKGKKGKKGKGAEEL